MVSKESLTKEERQILGGYTSTSLYRHIAISLLWAFFLISCFSFVISFPIWKWIAPSLGIVKPHEYREIFIVLSCLVGGAFVVSVLWKEFRYRNKSDNARNEFYKRVKQDLKDGFVKVEVLNVLKAVEIAEYEDEGAGFFLELEDGRVLCAIGQDLYDYAYDAETQPEEGIEDMRHLFPQTKIEYRYAPESGIRLGVWGVGEPLAASAIVKSHKGFFQKEKGGAQYYAGPEDGKFYEGTLEDVLNQFKLKPAVNGGGNV